MASIKVNGVTYCPPALARGIKASPQTAAALALARKAWRDKFASKAK